ncbi:hypothetical protein BY996DRAFT_3838636 [Phakopsora pachyrhizi]|nr:hypothetical protein BY996DRAFT_3838636 [Phakopsora pachyrhizi]
MNSSTIRQASHVHRPMIRFIGKRLYDKSQPKPTTHPLAPDDVKSKFSNLLIQQQRGGDRLKISDGIDGSSGGGGMSPDVMSGLDVEGLIRRYPRLSLHEISVVNANQPPEYIYIFYLRIIKVFPLTDKLGMLETV